MCQSQEEAERCLGWVAGSHMFVWSSISGPSPAMLLGMSSKHFTKDLELGKGVEVAATPLTPLVVAGREP